MINHSYGQFLTSLLSLTFLFDLALGISYPNIQHSDNRQPITDKRSETKPVLFSVTVTDKQERFIRDLTKEDFSVLDRETVQDLVSFSFQDSPISVGFLYDSSASMKAFRQDFTALIKENLMRFVGHSNEMNEYCIMSFNDNPKLVLDWSSDRKEISKAIDKSSVLAGGTAFFDACYMTVEKVNQGKNSRRVILLVSDGQIGFSRYSLKELRSLVRETDVIIYSIGLLDPLIDSLTGYGREILKELSSITGGKAYFPKTAGEFAQAIIKVSVELRNQYIIGVKSAGDGKWHGIKIRVKPKGNSGSEKQNKLEPFKVRSRSGYYAVNRNG